MNTHTHTYIYILYTYIGRGRERERYIYSNILCRCRFFHGVQLDATTPLLGAGVEDLQVLSSPLVAETRRLKSWEMGKSWNVMGIIIVK